MSASLWLVPRDGHPFTKEAQELISDMMPSCFPNKLKDKDFMPHVTLTSDIDPAKTYEASGNSPQEWLDSLQLPEFKKESNEVIVELDHVEVGDSYFRKVVIEVNENKNLTKLAAQCRREAVLNAQQNGQNGHAGEDDAESWAKTKYAPHMSLMYADLPTKDVKQKLPYVETQVGFTFGGLFACCGGTLCMGGFMVLVDTSKPVSEWKPIAKRETPWVNWRMTHNLT